MDGSDLYPYSFAGSPHHGKVLQIEINVSCMSMTFVLNRLGRQDKQQENSEFDCFDLSQNPCHHHIYNRSIQIQEKIL